MTPLRISGSTRRTVATLTATGLMTLGFMSSAAAQDFKIGVVSFLSGQAADSFGVPAVNGAKVLIDAFNQGDIEFLEWVNAQIAQAWPEDYNPIEIYG